MEPRLKLGGIPLYKKLNGKSYLVGSVAVSGDTPEVDEIIAISAAQDFSAPS